MMLDEIKKSDLQYRRCVTIICPLCFEQVDIQEKYKFCDGVNMDWVGGQEFGPKELRKRIEPSLASLFQPEHLSLLVGLQSDLCYALLAAGEGATGGSPEF